MSPTMIPCSTKFHTFAEIFQSKSMDVQENNNENRRTVGSLLLELGRLLLLLLLAILKRIIRIVYKSVRISVAFAKLCARSAIEWWQDKSTQEKVRFIRLKLRLWSRLAWKHTLQGCRKLWQWTVLGCKAMVKYSAIAVRLLWKGLVWLCTNLVQLILHMKPTLIRMGRAMKRGWKRMRRGMKLRRIRRKRGYEAFKRNGGMKHVLEQASKSLKSSIQSYMEEEQDDVDPNAITEDDIIEERFEELEQGNKAHAISKKIFSSVKNIVDTE